MNNEQETITKEIITRKRNDPFSPIYLFLTGGVRTGKTHTAKAIYHGLLHYYDKQLESDPLKRKGLILVFTGKAAYTIGGVTVHSALRLSFGSTKMLPLNSNTLDLLTK